MKNITECKKQYLNINVHKIVKKRTIDSNSYIIINKNNTLNQNKRISDSIKYLKLKRHIFKTKKLYFCSTNYKPVLLQYRHLTYCSLLNKKPLCILYSTHITEYIHSVY